jgi:hypothetical protein
MQILLEVFCKEIFLLYLRKRHTAKAYPGGMHRMHVDPYCFDADPDPAQNLDADPDPDPDPGGGG